MAQTALSDPRGLFTLNPAGMGRFMQQAGGPTRPIGGGPWSSQDVSKNYWDYFMPTVSPQEAASNYAYGGQPGGMPGAPPGGEYQFGGFDISPEQYQQMQMLDLLGGAGVLEPEQAYGGIAESLLTRPDPMQQLMDQYMMEYMMGTMGQGTPEMPGQEMPGYNIPGYGTGMPSQPTAQPAQPGWVGDIRQGYKDIVPWM